jgi:4-diphosphocytidyl-2-C-methyl-D-erythritol kinase
MCKPGSNKYFPAFLLQKFNNLVSVNSNSYFCVNNITNVNMKVLANAKINLGLNIVEKRPDGYHNLETLFYPVPFLYDEISIFQKDTVSSGKIKLISKGIHTEDDQDKNLIVKAFNLLNDLFSLPGTEVILIKQIPVGAGLGGGSSDAAFMLKSLNDFYKLGIKTDELENLATRLGADCPVFIKNIPVFATGTGNIFSPTDIKLDGYWLAIIKPDIHVSTQMAYSNVNPQKPGISLNEHLKLPVSEWRKFIKNDFETSIFNNFPEIKSIKELLYNAGALYASMSGSGSSVYGIFENEPHELRNSDTYQIFIGQI